MDLKNLCDPSVKQEIIDRINKLTRASAPQWGKMNVAQMLAHCQQPIGVIFGDREVQGNFILKLIGPLFKSVLYNEKPYKQSMPTDKSYVMVGSEKDFEEERSNLITMINRFSADSIILEKHPVFGRLTKQQSSEATWKHLDHHLKQFSA